MKLPNKIRGLHVFCTTCSIVCSNAKSKCGKQKHLLSKSCEGNKKYQSRIWNTITQKTDKIKTWDTKDLVEVVKLHTEYKQHLKDTEFTYKPRKVFKPVLFKDCAKMFMDWMQDIDVPEHEKKNLTDKHIKRTLLRMKAFADIVGRTLPITMVNSDHVGKFHNYLLNERGFKAETYNGYMDTCKHFFKFLLSRNYDLDNPFKDVKSRYVVKKVDIITEEEFDKLLSVVTPENGIRKYKGRERQLYFPWLVPAFKLARLTGGRREEVMTLKWEHVGDNYITVPNIKVNRAKKVEEHSFVPITQDLAELLLELKGDGYLIAPELKNRDTLVNYLTTCFSHYWELTGSNKDISFKHLRKTYLTRIRIKLGDKAKALKNHSSDEIQMNHYMSQQEIQKELVNVRLF